MPTVSLSAKDATAMQGRRDAITRVVLETLKENSPDCCSGGGGDGIAEKYQRKCCFQIAVLVLTKDAVTLLKQAMQQFIGYNK